ncbi:frequenin-1-like [Panonychus citri]|uniref:frequenin-1-like n=1 Tax=Panonychus citri TaxID=50023 RepID=UPI0023071282|nr:frequenin-1-like [Panonychus citri]
MGSLLNKPKTTVDFKALAAETPFPISQLKHWHQEFLRSCPHGYMTKEIFIETFHEYFSPDNINLIRLADYIFTKFDVNKDGVITFPEFIQAVTIPTHGGIDQKLEWAFSIYDTDGDGYITKAEMFSVVKALYERKGTTEMQLTLARERIDDIFSRMDLNRDNRLSRDEFINGFKQDPSIIRSLSGINNNPNYNMHSTRLWSQDYTVI